MQYNTVDLSHFSIIILYFDKKNEKKWTIDEILIQYDLLLVEGY